MSRVSSIVASGGGGYTDIMSRLEELLRSRYIREKATSTTMCQIVALVFGRPYSDVVKDVLVPNIDYWHYRSGENIDLFCIGFFGGESVPEQQDYSSEDFVRALTTFELNTQWKYSGETEIVLMNAIYAPGRHKSQQVRLDFSTVVSIVLERALEDKAIPSVPAFIEKLIYWAKDYQGANPTWDLSDSLGLRLAGDTLKTFALSLLPKRVGDNVTKAFHFYTRDLT